MAKIAAEEEKRQVVLAGARSQLARLRKADAVGGKTNKGKVKKELEVMKNGQAGRK